MMNDIALRALYEARPIPTWEDVLLQVVQTARPDATKDELRRTLQGLVDAGLADVTEHSSGRWFAAITERGLDLLRMRGTVGHEEISATIAAAAFKERGITVQISRAVKRRAQDIAGRPAQANGFEVDRVSLSAEHIVSAKRWADGRITITTIDGQKYQAP